MMLLKFTVVLGLLCCTSADYQRPSKEFSALAAGISQGRVGFDDNALHYKLDLPGLREQYDAAWQGMIPPLEDSVREVITIPLKDGGSIPGAWVHPPSGRKDPKAGVVIFYHGGGYMLGSWVMYSGAMTYLARDLDLPILFVDYTLAPELPMPGAVSECVDAHRWVLSNGVPADKIVFSGDSAGGGMTLLVLQALRGQSLPMPAAAVLLSPWTDLSMSGESLSTQEDVDAMLSGTTFTPQFSRTAVANKVHLQHPSVSPLFGNYEGLPPLFYLVGANEMLLSDTLLSAARARAQGVKVRVDVAGHMCHIYPLFADLFPEAKEARLEMKTFIHSHLSPGSKEEL